MARTCRGWSVLTTFCWAFGSGCSVPVPSQGPCLGLSWAFHSLPAQNGAHSSPREVLRPHPPQALERSCGAGTSEGAPGAGNPCRGLAWVPGPSWDLPAGRPDTQPERGGPGAPHGLLQPALLPGRTLRRPSRDARAALPLVGPGRAGVRGPHRQLPPALASTPGACRRNSTRPHPPTGMTH